ncbi:RNA polymerase sigma-70 factor (ECF subfamily) [Bosea sp. BE271]|nr:RNA polymerase sigma-70 factor (ECF subfamily) [Bosea robiniae]MDR6896302.1 RNA polymerase sigma-70 factor (ECF subfamily) [Bosea sp. BE109]MDR7139700.1 RNA polymerase sigma-70 factor (ECF subfamily) [Bosea sp. BE168]MDR7176578.1 RNA polymerase sigma-70 factor (ECF subfamily) [Bosea sp. BE271]
MMSPSEIASADRVEDLARERRTEDFKDGLIREIPNLRAFAASLSGSMQLADDLVQDTLLKAWGNSDKFEPGTSLRAWLFTILRNTYYSLYRKRGREVQDSEGTYAERMATHGNQESHLDLADFRKALAKLPEEQREVLIMVGATGLSYEEAAEICGVAIGTIKSRVNRARTKLAELLSIGSVDDLGPGRTNAAAMQRVGSEPVGF